MIALAFMPGVNTGTDSAATFTAVVIQPAGKASIVKVNGVVINTCALIASDGPALL
jgi:hypothetical protein